jgi:CheY-like chemotaxis protein
VEDEPSVRAMTSRILRAAGHSVVEAANGSEALRVLEGTTFDVLVSDIVMPMMSGLQLRQQVDIPTVLISGYTDDALDDLAELPPETALVMKPFTASELIQTVSRLAHKKAVVSSRSK